MVDLDEASWLNRFHGLHSRADLEESIDIFKDLLLVVYFRLL